MPGLITVDAVTQSFPLAGGGAYVALRDIDLDIAEGEFVSLIGHSGCGKSTLLNLLAGLTRASEGGILLDGREVTSPGPDRMVVFQNYSLLPWQTVRQNIALAVRNVLTDLTPEQQRERVDEQLKLVGLAAAADKHPAELSGGMKQRVAIARALAIQPRLLLLDEPFGALDALTRGNLQQQLMQLCQASGITTVMVTHDVDEALLLSDRVVMLTNGPEARIGQILEVPLPRPRQRLEVMEHPDYYQLRSELIGFLQQQRRLRQRKQSLGQSTLQPDAPRSGRASATKTAALTTVRIGYLPGLDSAPLAVALERQLFDRERLRVLPVPFTRWQQLEEKLMAGELEAAITSATAPLALSLGLHGQAPWPAITPMTVTRNGNAVCLSQRFLNQGLTDLAALAQRQRAGTSPLRLAIAQRGNMQELLLRHWLANGGLDPDRDLQLRTLSPMAMQAALRAGEIDGFIAGRYRVARAVEDGLAYVVATDRDIWPAHPEKVLTCHEAWAESHRQALLDLCAGLLQAGPICDDGGQRPYLIGLLSDPQWLGPSSALALQRQFDFGTGEQSSDRLLLNRYHADRAQVPDQAEGAWMLSQFSRWGWCPFPSNRLELLSQTYRGDLYEAAMAQAGLPCLWPERQPFALADGRRFDQDAPLRYLDGLPCSATPTVEPVTLPPAASPRPLAASRDARHA